MKKFIALLLLSAICFSLMACTNNEGKAIVGVWERGDWKITFYDDGTGVDPDGGDIRWEYNKKEQKYIVELLSRDMKFETSVDEDNNGKEYFTLKNLKYYRVSD